VSSELSVTVASKNASHLWTFNITSRVRIALLLISGESGKITAKNSQKTWQPVVKIAKIMAKLRHQINCPITIIKSINSTLS